MRLYFFILSALAVFAIGQESCSDADNDGDGWTITDGDCDDHNADIHPGADEVCDGVDNDCDSVSDSGVLGGDATCAASSCLELVESVEGVEDGLYWISLESGSTLELFCDMTTAGGGWTRFWWYEGGTGMSEVTDTLGQSIEDCDSTIDTACYARIPAASPSELLVTNHFEDWGVWTFDSSNTTSNRALEALVNGNGSDYSSSSCGDGWPATEQYGSMTDDPFHCDETNNDGGSCRCFWYADYNGVVSFYLDDDTGWAETAFGAGYDNGGYLGVDSLETEYRYHSEDYSLWLYYR